MKDSRNLWRLRALAVVIAVGLWFIYSYQPRIKTPVTRTMMVPVFYQDLEELILVDQIEEVQVTLAGGDDAFANLVPDAISVNVEFDKPKKGSNIVELKEDLLSGLQSGLRAVDFVPNRFGVRLEEKLRRRVQVDPQTTGETAAGAIVRTLRTNPKAVLVEGPKSVVERMPNLTTAPISLQGRAKDFVSENVLVICREKGVRIVEPTTVDVEVLLQIPEAPPGALPAEEDEGEEPLPSSR